MVCLICCQHTSTVTADQCVAQCWKVSVTSSLSSEWTASSTGGGVQPAVRASRAAVQEAARHSLFGLRPERQRHPGWLCGARAAQDGGPDAGLRPVLISKSQRRDDCGTRRLNSNWILNDAFECFHSAFRLTLYDASTAPIYRNDQ